jgi:PAS domain S-box-containing protein
MLLPSHTGTFETENPESIYAPASIQLYGILFVLQEPLLKIIQVSDNTFEAIGFYPREILGKFLDDFFGTEQVAGIKKTLSEEGESFKFLNIHIETKYSQDCFEGKLHRSDGAIILELERVATDRTRNSIDCDRAFKKALDKIQKATNLQDLCQFAAEEVRKFIGFDRTLVYRFDEVGAGGVIAESKLENLSPLLGLCYPASDIPLAARRLFSENLVRFIPEVSDRTVPLIPSCNPLTSRPLDMSFSFLKTVSPCHIQYLKNMGAGASLTLSLIENNKLWGLIACHNQKSQYVSYEVRSACELLAKFISLEISYKQDRENREYESYLKSICAKLLRDISPEHCFGEGLLKHQDNLLKLVGATGAVLCDREQLTCIGKTPGMADLKNLIEWGETQLKDDIYYTDSLPQVYPNAEKFKEVTSGLLVLAISQMQKNYILWLRPEVIQTVNWAGKSDRSPEFDSGVKKLLSPRNSFELWQETVRLKSLPWQQCEIEIALELKAALVSIELRKINQQLTLALSATKMGFWDWDLVNNCIIWSREHEELFGLAPGSFQGTYEGFAACVHPEDLTTLNKAVDRTRTDRQDFDREYRVVWPDGSIHWIEGKGKFFYSETGEAVRMVGTVIEITDRKAKEVQLHLLESAITTTNDAILITEAQPIDEPGPRILYVNPAFTRMTGYTAAEVLDKTPRILQGEKTDRASLARIRTALKSWQPLRIDLQNYRKDGSQFWVELSLVPICNEAGWFTHWVAVQRDISDRKLAEATLQQLNEELEMRVLQRTKELELSQSKLRQSEALFRSLSECSPVGIFKVDADGQCIYTNPRCQAICGFTAEEALGNGWMRFVYPEDLNHFLSLWSDSAAHNGEFSCEFRHIYRDGTIRFCRVKTAPIFSAQGKLTGHVGTVADITESRAIEKMKNEFISIVSHELRTPLASIRGSLGLLAAGVLKNNPETAKQMLEIASSDTERLVRLVNDILDLERLDSSKVTLVKQRCDAGVLMRQSAETVRSIAAEHKINVSVLPADVQIWADPDRIVQMLVNLLSNAVKFSPPASTVTVKVEDLGDRVLFEVKDRGRGIPADKLETIFGRFQQVDASDSRQKGGTGLGLAICRGIVQQHGGRIWAESTVGEGSSFYFTLPAPFEE